MALQPAKEHDVFISYAREELKFVGQLRGGLEATGLQVWVDLEGVYGGEEFWPVICKAIDAAAAVVYVISPNSAASPYCRREVERAIAASKRIVPVCRQEVDAALLPPEVASRQWIFFRSDDEAKAADAALVGAIRADWGWVRRHARLLVRAEEWRAADRDPSLTLRGRELREADDWLAHPLADHAPAPLQVEYVRASREALRQRLRRFAGMAAAALAAIGIVSWLAVNSEISSLNLGALDDLKKGQTERAFSQLASAERLCGRVPVIGGRCEDVASNFGSALLDVGRYDDAIVRFSRFLEDTKASPESATEVQGRRAVAYRNRAYARIVSAEMITDGASRDRAYVLALEDVAAASRIEERILGTPKLQDSALATARVLLGRGAYEEALAKIDFAARFEGHENAVALLRALAYDCLVRKDESALREYLRKGKRDKGQFDLDMAYYERVANRCKSQQR
jgi:tetratricopeptide (TPR) repeat protein